MCNIYKEIRAATVAEQHRVATQAVVEHKLVQEKHALVESSGRKLEKQAAALACAVIKHVSLDREVAEAHEQGRSTLEEMVELVDNSKGDGGVDGAVDELAAALGLPAESDSVGPSRSSVETGDVVAGGGGEEPAPAPKAAARKAKVPQATVPVPIGGFAYRCPCGRGYNRKGSFTKHKAQCPEAPSEDYWRAEDADSPHAKRPRRSTANYSAEPPVAGGA